MDNLDDKIKSYFLNLIKKNIYINDVLIYGNISDSISDLDLLIIYNKYTTIKFPKFIKNRIKDGTVNYLYYKNLKNIFYFEDLKLFSIKKKIFIKNHLSKKTKNFVKLSSFLDRYYERRSLLGISYKNKEKRLDFLFKNRDTESLLRVINSYIYSVKYFFDYKKKIEKYLIVLFEDFFQKYLLCRKLLKDKKKINFNLLYEELVKFDKYFFIYSSKNLNKKFYDSNCINILFSFPNKKKFESKKNTKFAENELYKTNVPTIFITQFMMYSSKENDMSKKIRKSFNINPVLKKTIPKLLLNIWNKKIETISIDYMNLKKAGQKRGLYRWTWYL